MSVTLARCLIGSTSLRYASASALRACEFILNNFRNEVDIYPYLCVLLSTICLIYTINLFCHRLNTALRTNESRTSEWPAPTHLLPTWFPLIPCGGAAPQVKEAELGHSEANEETRLVATHSFVKRVSRPNSATFPVVPRLTNTLVEGGEGRGGLYHGTCITNGLLSQWRMTQQPRRRHVNKRKADRQSTCTTKNPTSTKHK